MLVLQEESVVTRPRTVWALSPEEEDACVFKRNEQTSSMANEPSFQKTLRRYCEVVGQAEPKEDRVADHFNQPRSGLQHEVDRRNRLFAGQRSDFSMISTRNGENRFRETRQAVGPASRRAAERELLASAEALKAMAQKAKREKLAAIATGSVQGSRVSVSAPSSQLADSSMMPSTFDESFGETREHESIDFKYALWNGVSDSFPTPAQDHHLPSRGPAYSRMAQRNEEATADMTKRNTVVALEGTIAAVLARKRLDRVAEYCKRELGGVAFDHANRDLGAEKRRNKKLKTALAKEVKPDFKSSRIRKNNFSVAGVIYMSRRAKFALREAANTNNKLQILSYWPETAKKTGTAVYLKKQAQARSLASKILRWGRCYKGDAVIVAAPPPMPKPATPTGDARPGNKSRGRRRSTGTFDMASSPVMPPRALTAPAPRGGRRSRKGSGARRSTELEAAGMTILEGSILEGSTLLDDNKRRSFYSNEGSDEDDAKKQAPFEVVAWNEGDDGTFLTALDPNDTQAHKMLLDSNTLETGGGGSILTKEEGESSYWANQSLSSLDRYYYAAQDLPQRRPRSSGQPLKGRHRHHHRHHNEEESEEDSDGSYNIRPKTAPIGEEALLGTDMPNPIQSLILGEYLGRRRPSQESEPEEEAGPEAGPVASPKRRRKSSTISSAPKTAEELGYERRKSSLSTVSTVLTTEELAIQTRKSRLVAKRLSVVACDLEESKKREEQQQLAEEEQRLLEEAANKKKKKGCLGRLFNKKPKKPQVVVVVTEQEAASSLSFEEVKAKRKADLRRKSFIGRLETLLRIIKRAVKKLLCCKRRRCSLAGSVRWLNALLSVPVPLFIKAVLGLVDLTFTAQEYVLSVYAGVAFEILKVYRLSSNLWHHEARYKREDLVSACADGDMGTIELAFLDKWGGLTPEVQTNEGQTMIMLVFLRALSLDQQVEDRAKNIRGTEEEDDDDNLKHLLDTQATYTKILTKLLAYGAKINTQQDQKKHEGTGWRLLHHASMVGRLDRMAWLLDQGAIVDLDTSKGETALMIAAMSKKPQAVQFLMEHNASVANTDADGQTPLHYAAKSGAIHCCAILLRGGASKKARTNGDYQTPADMALRNGHKKAYELIRVFREEEVAVAEIFDEFR